MGLKVALRSLFAMETGKKPMQDPRLDCVFLDRLEERCPSLAGVIEAVFYDACSEDELGGADMGELAPKAELPSCGSPMESGSIRPLAVVPAAQGKRLVV